MYGNAIYVTNLAGSGRVVVAFKPDLTVAWSLTTPEMADLVDDFAGSAIVDRAVSAISRSRRSAPN